MEQFIIKSSQLAISPRKMNLVAGLIRKKELDFSLNLLAFLPKKGGRKIHKLLQGAVKNLIRSKEETSNFYLDKIEVNSGRIQKKVLYRARGRTDRVRRRYCSVNLYLAKKEKNSKINNKEDKVN